MPIPAPVLSTGRLQLSGHRIEDFDDCLAMWSRPEVTRHIGGQPSSPEDVWARLLRYVGHWSLLGFGYWVVRDGRSGAFVGEVGLADFRRCVDPQFDGSPEIGWALHPQAWGHGYALEAIQAVLRWADAALDGPPVVCMIDPQNDRSIRLAERCGFRRYAEATYRGAGTTLFSRTARCAGLSASADIHAG